MATRREESDGRVVPEGRRKAVPTARRERGGKVTTASQRAGQRDLFLETADSPQGAVPGARTGQPVPRVRYAVPKSRNIPGETLPAMTMEEVAGDDNLIGRSRKWHKPRGAWSGWTEHRRGARASRRTAPRASSSPARRNLSPGHDSPGLDSE